MPIDQDADVTMLIKGLALCCRNRNRDRWEVALPAVGEHRLQITIYRQPKAGGEPQVFHSVPINELSEGRLRVETNDAVWSDKFYFEGPNGFSWSNPQNNDPNDFRFFIDLEDEILTHKKQKHNFRIPFVKLSLEKTMLYTHELTDSSYLLKDMNGGEEPKHFYILGKVIGGYLKVSNPAQAKVEFKFDGKRRHNKTLDNFAVYKYFIEFDNDCDNKRKAEKDSELLTCESDFPLYYELVTPEDAADTRRFTLEKSSGSRGRVDCDGAWVSQMSNLF